MPFQPLVNDGLQIDDLLYRIAEHPTAPGLPYGQEGRQATVYQVITEPAAGAAGQADRRAIKAFKPRFRSPALVILAERLVAFADLPGLAVCRRQVLTPGRHRALLAAHPDLIYAVVMPWIDGPTWFEVVVDRRPLTPAQALGLARSLTTILCQMEQRGLAHCDLSGSNIILPGLIEGRPAEAGEAVALVDVESLFGPGLDQPIATTSGSPGYQLPTGEPSAWNATADRFSGAILLTEMLGWCDERARSAAWGESYFEPTEHQHATERYQLMTTVLHEWWGPGVVRLLDRAWQSTVQSECPTFGEWQMALPDAAPASRSPRPAAAGWSATDTAAAGAAAQPPPAADATDTAARTLFDLGRQREAAGDREMARTLYRQALALAPAGGALALELNAALATAAAPATAAAAATVGTPTTPTTAAQPTPEAAPPTPPTPPTRSATPDPEIQMLFDDALVAYGAQDLERTRQLLRDVVRRQPQYARDDQSAQALLTEVERRLAPPAAAGAGAAGAVAGATGRTAAPVPPTPRPGGRPATGRIVSWALAAAILVVTLIGAAWLLRGGLGWGGAQPTTTTAGVPTGTVSTIASAATPTAAQAATPTVAAKPTAPLAAATPAPGAATPTPAPAATAAAASPAPTPSAAPAVAAGGKLVILYSAHYPEIHDSQIWSMGVDGANQRSFTATRGHSWAPRVSPDGQRFFFSSVAPGEHVSHDPTGGGTTKNPGNHDIYVASADGADIQNITSKFNAWDNAWSWSPDGKWIAFSSDRDGNWEIYKMTVTGESITRLTSHPGSDGWPSWSPDGKTIVFASDRSGNWEVFSMGDDGATPRQLTERKEAYNTFPTVSPDGKKIAFSSQLPERKEGEIYLMNLDGTGLTRLTRGSVSLNNVPTFCPDGRIVFVSDRSGNDDIWIMNGDGSNPVQLTAQRGEDTTPSCGYLRGA